LQWLKIYATLFKHCRLVTYCSDFYHPCFAGTVFSIFAASGQLTFLYRAKTHRVGAVLLLASFRRSTPMQVKIGCELVYQTAYVTPLVLLIRPRPQYNHKLLKESRRATPDVHIHEFVDGFGNYLWRVTAPAGELRLHYDALAEVIPEPDPVLMDLPGSLVQNLPDETLPFLLPSRHCPSDLVIGDAWQLFGQTTPGWPRVQAICDWLHSNVTYNKGSNSSTTGYDAYMARQGVCRDFAHLGVMFCRALSIPARYVCGYLPDIGIEPDPTPMDFHAWFEAFVGGEWHTFDARHNVPRTGRVLIGQGRDAVDVALATSYGDAWLKEIRVWADEVKEGPNNLQPALQQEPNL
jgi:transglutaminase-like putative cysteine protease